MKISSDFFRKLSYTYVFGKIKDVNGKCVAVMKKGNVYTSEDSFIASLVPTDISGRFNIFESSGDVKIYDVIDSRTDKIIARIDKNLNLFDVKGLYIGTLSGNNKIFIWLYIISAIALITFLLFIILLNNSTSITDFEIVITDYYGNEVTENWNIFGEREVDKVIYPGKSYTYVFNVKNTSKADVDFRIDFDDINYDNVPIRYRLSSYEGYLVGDDSSWVDIDELVLDTVIIKSESEMSFALEWKWISESDTIDTFIGNSNDAKYTITLIHTSTLHDGE